MTTEKKESYPSVSQSFGIVGIIILSMLVFSPVMIIIDHLIGKEIAFLVYYIFSMGAPFLIINSVRKKKTQSGSNTFDLSLDNFKVVLLITVTIIAIQIGFISPIVNSMPVPEFMQQMFMELASQNGVLSFITLVIAAPILEELIFRGIILDGLLKRYSPVKSIIISSVLFGIVHLNPWQFISAVIIGFFIGWVYYKTRKLSLAILIHMTNNFLAFIMMRFTTPEEMFSTPLVESYGGGLPVFIIVTFGAIGVAILGILYLKKSFNIADATNSRTNEI